MTSYRIVLPAPWERIALDATLHDSVRALIDRAVARLPKEIPPDQVAPQRRILEKELTGRLLEARDNGGIDYYLPTDLMHGQQLNASFVVSMVIPDAAATPDLVPRVLAQLMSGPETRPVSVGETVWARTEKVLHREPDGLVKEQLAVRKVEYVTALPGDERRWVLVTFTTLGDGDVDSEATTLITELFDAMMTTWRWV